MTEIYVPATHLLWRTRGATWDYLFLLVPDLGVPSWYHMVNRLSDQLGHRGGIGRFVYKNNNAQFFAFSQFTDPEWRDRVNRPILHTFIVGLEGSECKRLPADWGIQIYGQLKDIYRDAYQLAKEDIPHPENLEDYLRHYVEKRFPVVVIRIPEAAARTRAPVAVDINLDVDKPVPATVKVANSEETPGVPNVGLLHTKVPDWCFWLSILATSILSYFLGLLHGLR